MTADTSPQRRPCEPPNRYLEMFNRIKVRPSTARPQAFRFNDSFLASNPTASPEARDERDREPVVTGRAFEVLLAVKADPRNLEDRVAAMILSNTSRYAADFLLRYAIDLDVDSWWRLLIAYAPDLDVVGAIIEELTVEDGDRAWTLAPSGVAEEGCCGE